MAKLWLILAVRNSKDPTLQTWSIILLNTVEAPSLPSPLQKDIHAECSSLKIIIWKKGLSQTLISKLWWSGGLVFFK